MTERWKGFDLARLADFGIKRTRAGVEAPYYTRRGKHWRSKLFRDDGETRWLGESRAQIPYGLETLNHGGDALVLTEGESDALALRLAFPKLAVLGLPGASSWKREWARCVAGFATVYLSFDGDEAGERLAQDVLDSIPDAIPIWLPGGADTRDLLQRLGRGPYSALVEHARAAVTFNRAFDRSRIVHDAWAELAA